MAFEKFYGSNDVFFGWHCVMCGDIVDPVILLNRISRDPQISIPETEEKIISLIRRYRKGKGSGQDTKRKIARDYPVAAG